MKRFYPLFFATAMLIGATIGAGVFGIPYVASRAGVGLSLFYILVLGIATILINLAYAEIVVNTPTAHQLPGYSRLYLGRLGYSIAIVAVTVGVLGGLLAYMIGAGQFLHLLLKPYFDVTAQQYSFIFYALGFLVVLTGIRRFAKLEIILVTALIALLISVITVCFSRFSLTQLSGFEMPMMFLPYGVILFALSSAAIVPEVRQLVEGKHRFYQLAIIIGTLVPMVLYALFAYAVVGVSGANTSEDAISGLIPFLSPRLVQLGALIGVLAITSSFLAMCFVFLDILVKDFKWSRSVAVGFEFVLPLMIYLIGARGFVEAIGFAGAIMGGLTGIIVLLSYLGMTEKSLQRIRIMPIRQPIFIYGIICLLFIGILVELIPLFLDSYLFR